MSALVQKATGTNASGTTVTVSLTGVTAGNLLTAIFGGANGTTGATQSLADTNGSWTPAQNPTAPTTGEMVGLYYQPNCSSGTHNLTLTMNHTGSGELTICEWSGIATSSPLDVSSHTTDTPSSPITASGTTTTTDLCIGVMCNNSGSASTGITDPPTGYTTIYVQQSGATLDAMEACYKTGVAAGAQTISWSYSAGTNADAIFAAFKESTSGANTTITPTAGSDTLAGVAPSVVAASSTVLIPVTA